MRLPLNEMLEKLGIDRVLEAYETQPWLHYDEEQGITASAEVRMGPGQQDMEAEIQFLYDDIEDIDETKSDEDEDEEGDDGSGGGPEPEGPPIPKRVIRDGREQIMILRALPAFDEMWEIKILTVRTNSYVGAFHEWEEKGCEFFTMCVQSMNMGELPDIDDMIEKTLNKEDYWGGGKRGRIGRKSPKIKPAALMGGGKPGGM